MSTKTDMRAKIITDMGAAYEQLGDYTTAREYYRQGLQMSPSTDNASFLGYARTFTDEKIAALSATVVEHPTAKGYWQTGSVTGRGRIHCICPGLLQARTRTGSQAGRGPNRPGARLEEQTHTGLSAADWPGGRSAAMGIYSTIATGWRSAAAAERKVGSAAPRNSVVPASRQAGGSKGSVPGFRIRGRRSGRRRRTIRCSAFSD